MNIEKLYELFLFCGKVCTDTRNIIPGSIFFALKGDNFDGNLYALEAVASGAAYAVVDNAEIKGEKILYYNNVLETLQRLASIHRKKSHAIVIGITGTNGKTTTKELIATVLSSQKKIIYTQGNLNNHIGVPLTLLNIKDDTEYAVVEMGANHPGEIEALCQIADPDFGMITNVGKAHLEGFGSFEGVVKTKTELYRYLHLRNRKVFVNSDNPNLIPFAQVENDLLYGTYPNALVSGAVVSCNPFVEIEWKSKSDIETHYCKTNLIGIYNFENILAAITIGCYFGIESNKMNKALESYFPSNHRSQLIKKETNEILLDAYNANPTSMNAAIDNFSQIAQPEKVMIIGDMFELGKEGPAEHEAILVKLLALKNVKIFVAGKTYSLYSGSYPFRFFETTKDLCEELKDNRIMNSFVLVKGSRGMKMEQVLDYL